MNRDAAKTLIVVAGPTASGKTAAAIELARHYQTVILSADSRQFYREMSIGTAKPTAAELAAVRHYFIDNISVNETCTAGDYEQQALNLLNELFKTQDKVILAGGSGLFIKAVCEGFDKFPVTDPSVRERLNKELEKTGIAHLQHKLKLADPEYYDKVDLGNPQRIIRALEVFESSGKPYSSFRGGVVNKRPFGIVKLGLNMDRAELYQRINQRVDHMLADGLLEEVKGLLPQRHLNALNTVGYTEFFDHFDDKTDLATAIGLVKQNTRRFAKRQLTWFTKDKQINWLNAAEPDLIQKMIGIIDHNNPVDQLNKVSR